MMKEANPGITDPKKWKPPAGYNSALANARDAAKAAEDNKTGKLAAFTNHEDTVSEGNDDDFDTFSQVGSVRCCALLPVQRGTPMAKAISPRPIQCPINAVNKFEGLDTHNRNTTMPPSVRSISGHTRFRNHQPRRYPRR